MSVRKQWTEKNRGSVSVNRRTNRSTVAVKLVDIAVEWLHLQSSLSLHVYCINVWIAVETAASAAAPSMNTSC